MRILGTIGDINPTDYGGGVILDTEHGPVLEYTYGVAVESVPFDDDELMGVELEVFSCRLDEPALEMFSGWGDDLWPDVARSNGMDLSELLEHAASLDPLVIASCVESVAMHWGWREIDCYPETMTYGEIEARWSGLDHFDLCATCACWFANADTSGASDSEVEAIQALEAEWLEEYGHALPALGDFYEPGDGDDIACECCGAPDSSAVFSMQHKKAEK